jgi:transglutaminase-like putative cysteine protease
VTLYDIDLKLGYAYTAQAAGGRHVLRLMPADLPGRQRLIAGHLSARPEPTERFEGRDFFGNRTTEIAWRESHSEIDIRLQARVERMSDRGALDMSPPLAGLAREIAGIGVTAGYVSGFLRTIPPPGTERLEGADAMHAWVRAWCGRQTGWVEFDPTNDLWVDTDHVVVAYGRDYGDVAPMKGVLRSSGGEQKGTHAVDVIPLEA